MRAFLKGQCHEIFNFQFFHELVSSKPLSSPLGPSQFFRKFAEILAAQVHHRVNETSGKWEKTQKENFNYFG
jgi:hypothetical protein